MTKNHSKQPVTLRGIVGSKGYSIAKAYVFKKRIEVKRTPIPDDKIEFELSRLDQAVRLTNNDIEIACKKAAETHGKKYAAIFESHILMLQDSRFLPEIIKRLKEEKINVESIVRERVDEIQNMFKALDDPYMRERAVDIKDIGRRLLGHLLGIDGPAREIGKEPFILIAQEITPGEILDFAKAELKGVCLDTGGATSHVAILSSAMGIPSIFGLGNLSVAARTGDMLLIDSRYEGKVILHPDKSMIDELKETEKKSKTPKTRSEITQDGFKVQLAANISRPEELDLLKKMDVKKVGLFRSEFLFMQSSDFPSEKLQYDVYKKVITTANELTVFRTIDIGSDKPLKYVPLTPEENPAMGYRSVRFSLSRPDILIPQLKAMIRAAQYGNCQIIFPMISTIEELGDIAKIYKKAAKQAKIDNPPEWGIMLEVPSAVFMLKTISRYTKYISLGTNDLLQFFFAIDRTNNKLANHATPLSSPFLNFVDLCVTEAKKYGIKVGVCGEMASDPLGFLVLLGLGIEQFSMRPRAINDIKEIIALVERKKVLRLVQKIIKKGYKVNVKNEIVKEFPHLAELV